MCLQAYLCQCGKCSWDVCSEIECWVKLMVMSFAFNIYFHGKLIECIICGIGGHSTDASNHTSCCQIWGPFTLLGGAPPCRKIVLLSIPSFKICSMAYCWNILEYGSEEIMFFTKTRGLRTCLTPVVNLSGCILEMFHTQTQNVMCC
jgi:hypothetical protein